MRHSTTNKRILSYSLLISSFLFLILIWTLVSIYYNNDLIFPSINQIIQAFFGIFKESTNMKALFLTIMRVIVSVIVCFILGFLIDKLIFVLICFIINDVIVGWFFKINDFRSVVNG